MRRNLILIATFLLFLLTACEPAPPVPPPPLPPGALWFGVWILVSLLEWFNKTARENDIGTVHRSRPELLEDITAGRRQLVFASAAVAEAMVPEWAHLIDVLGYDIEHWDATPDDEQADPVAAVKRMRALADEYGLELAVGPDRKFAEDFGAAMAPFCDRFVVQTQRIQHDPAEALRRNLALMQELREANPDLEFSIVLAPDSGNVADLLELVSAFRDWIVGVSLLPGPGEEEAVMEFVRLLREG